MTRSFIGKDLPEEIARLAGPIEPERDIWEQQMIAEILAQKKPLFGICRGHQMLNVALGGTLVVDIAAQVPNALNHRRMDRKSEPVHDVTVAPDSLLAKLTGRETFGVNSTHHQAVGRVAPQPAGGGAQLRRGDRSAGIEGSRLRRRSCCRCNFIRNV